jgi:uncharacterized protein (UPF0332 family)
LANKFLTELAKVTRDGETESVHTGLKDGLNELVDAQKNLETAKLGLSVEDYSGSFSMAYLAARKSVQSVLTAHGKRVKAVGNSHIVFVNVAKITTFESECWVRLDWMRSVRNNADYPKVNFEKVNSADCEEAIKSAELMLQDAMRILNDLG